MQNCTKYIIDTTLVQNIIDVVIILNEQICKKNNRLFNVQAVFLIFFNHPKF